MIGPDRIDDLRADGTPPTAYAAGLPPFAGAGPLAGEADAEVAVIGGGFCGLSAALHLARAGRSVRLVEAQTLGAGASGRNGGQVHTGQRLETTTLRTLVGEDDTRALWRYGEEAQDLVREIAAGDADGCFLAPGIVVAAARPGDLAGLVAEAEHVAARYGHDDWEVIPADRLPEVIGTRRFHGGLRDRRSFHLDPWRYVQALARAAAGAGALLHPRTAAKTIGRDGNRWRLALAGGGSLRADAVVVAANGYLGRLLPVAAAHAMPLNSFIAATAPLPEERFRALIPGGEAVCDTRFVVRYWRPTADRRLAFGGGETYGDRFPTDIAGFVRRYLLEVYPQLADVPIEHAWGGTLAVTPNRAPFIRRLEPGLYTACGFSGQGVAVARHAGRVLAEAICGDTGRLDVFERLPVPAFPGAGRLRAPLSMLAMTWFALRDRLGI